MNRRLLKIVFLLGIFYSNVSLAQESEFISSDIKFYNESKHFFDIELYRQAMSKAEDFLSLNKQTWQHSKNITYKYQPLNIKHISALRLELPEAEENLKTYINKNHPNPFIRSAIIDLADYYYNEKNYVECIEYYDKINLNSLLPSQMSEIAFKKGYCHFVRQEFERAKYTFSFSKDVQNKFFYPVNYYYGMSEYFLGDYSGAVKSFQRVESNNVYKPLIPYYIAQIYFAQKEYDQLLSYGENIVKIPSTRKKKEIRLLLGQTYFLRNDYGKALPHLEFYEANSPQLTVEEFFQLAFAQYKTNQCEKAIDNFLEINRENTKIGQVVNYYLADCYHKKGDMTSARAAFKKVSDMSFDLGMKEEALFNYGKLSAEMGQEREAINILMDVSNSSPYYNEATSIINDVLVNTSDYANAIEIIESLNSLNKQIEETYQQVTFKLGIQKLSEDNDEEAQTLFDKSYEYKFDKDVVAQIDFWRAVSLNTSGYYEESNAAFDQYFVSSSSASSLPISARPYVAHYNMAYNYLKLKEYVKASESFKTTIQGINTERDNIPDATLLERILPDAYARAGDCLFKVNRYDDAATYYDQYIDRKSPGFEYALFQRGIIEGLVNQPYEKILTMEELVKDHPTSDFADNALQQLGDTYLTLGSPIPAAEAYRKILTDYGKKSNLLNAANLKLGLINYNEGDIEGSLAYYKNVFRNNPNPKESQEAILAIEEIYIDDLGQTDEYFNFIQTVPGYEVSAFVKDSLNYRIGEIQYQNSNYEKAIAGYNEYLKVYNRGYYRLNAHFFRGESYSLSKKYNKALKDYEVIIEEGISDFYEKSLKKAAIISYNHNENFDKAFGYYKKWEEQTTNPEDEYLAQMGVLRSAFRTGRREVVMEYGRKVSTNPMSSVEDKNSALYYLGMISYANKNYEKASQAFERLSNNAQSNQAAESRYMLAKISYDQDKLAEAITLANSANEKNGSYPFWIAKSILLLSDVYLDQGDLLNARAAVEAVLENFKTNNKIVDEAKSQLESITQKESASNRVRTQNTDGTLQLDTSGNK